MIRNMARSSPWFEWLCTLTGGVISSNNHRSELVARIADPGDVAPCVGSIAGVNNDCTDGNWPDLTTEERDWDEDGFTEEEGDCDDQDPCTADSCDGITGCANDPITGCVNPPVPTQSWPLGGLAMLVVLVGAGLALLREERRLGRG